MDLVTRLHRYHIAGASLERVEQFERAPMYLMRVPQAAALSRWHTLRHLVSETGYWPVIGWDSFNEEKASPVEFIAAAMHLDVVAWFQQEQEWNGSLWEMAQSGQNSNPAFPRFAFTIHEQQYSSTSAPLVPIALVPTRVPWYVPAYLPISLSLSYGDHPPQVHIALLKYWNERYGAEVVGMVIGMLEFRVLRPPQTYEAAYKLAEEQYLYCSDLIDQNIGSIAQLAKFLVQSSVWWFWWD